MPIPKDFYQLISKETGRPLAEGPVYHLWVFNPEDGKVTLEHNEDRHRAHTKTHDDLAQEVAHPQRVHGYAYKIEDGYRITDRDHHPVEDPYIAHRVLETLKVKG